MMRGWLLLGWFLCIAVARAEPGRLTDHYTPTPTSVRQFSDLQPGGESDTELQLLVERYGVGFGLADGKFHGERPLSRGELAYFLLQGLERIDKMAAALPYRTDWHPYSLYHHANRMTPRDLPSEAPYSAAVRRLLHKYRVNLTEPDGLFHGQRAASEKEAYACLRGIFRYNRSYDSLNSERAVTRLEFAHALSDSLDDCYMMMVEELEERHL